VLLCGFSVFYGKFNVLVSQGMITFPEGNHQSFVGKSIDEPWNPL
jgi:hypothetical protein